MERSDWAERTSLWRYGEVARVVVALMMVREVETSTFEDEAAAGGGGGGGGVRDFSPWVAWKRDTVVLTGAGSS